MALRSWSADVPSKFPVLGDNSGHQKWTGNRIRRLNDIHHTVPDFVAKTNGYGQVLPDDTKFMDHNDQLLYCLSPIWGIFCVWVQNKSQAQRHIQIRQDSVGGFSFCHQGDFAVSNDYAWREIWEGIFALGSRLADGKLLMCTYRVSQLLIEVGTSIRSIPFFSS